MKTKQASLLLHLLLLLSLLAPLPVSAQTATVQAAPAKIQSYLTQLAKNEPTEQVALIIQKATTDDRVERFVQRNGGTVTRSLRLINAFAAEAPASLIPQLAELSGVRRVSIDAPMVNQSSGLSGSVSAQDDFTTVAYNGSDGSFAWQSDWQEIGEADGADQGDVGITAFWGGRCKGCGCRARPRAPGASSTCHRRAPLNCNSPIGARISLLTAITLRWSYPPIASCGPK